MSLLRAQRKVSGLSKVTSVMEFGDISLTVRLQLNETGDLHGIGHMGDITS